MTAKSSKGRYRLLACVTIAILGLVGCGQSDEKEHTAAVGNAFNIVETDIKGIQAAIRSGQVSCVDVVRAHLRRIKAYDAESGLNAISFINENAVKRAEEIDQAIASGDELGPLFCAPVLVKDNFDTHDMPTTGGSVAMANVYPPNDAFMVRRIREAGAIVLAKTNMAEWAFSPRQTKSSTKGATANAYALDRVPAGSSGGTASGVAASFGVAGLGSDTGNSIRGPSSHLALFGIRSTIGLTSRDGVIPLAFDRDIAGPMTRSVEDGARLFNVIAGYDPQDPFTEEAKDRPTINYLDFLDAEGLKGARLGVLRSLADPAKMDSQVAALFADALESLQDAGAEVVDPFEVPDLEKHLNGSYFCARFRYDMSVYLETLGEAAPFTDVATVLETGQYSPYVKERLEWAAKTPLDVAPEDWEKPCPSYLKHPERKAFLEDVVKVMDELQLDAVIYPTWTHPPAHMSNAAEEYKGDNSQLIAPPTGMPAVTVPMGYTNGTLPAGLQILTRRFEEHLLFRFAYAYEQHTMHRQQPTNFPPLIQKKGTAENK